MENLINTANIIFIVRELEWLKEVINTRLKLYYKNDTKYASIEEVEPQKVTALTGEYDVFVAKHKLNAPDRIALILPFVPILRPQLFDVFCIRNSDTGRQFVEFGGIYGTHYMGFIPTLETLLFILSGNDTELRLWYYCYFECHFLFSQEMIIREQLSVNEPPTTAMLIPSKTLLSQLIREEIESRELNEIKRSQTLQHNKRFGASGGVTSNNFLW